VVLATHRAIVGRFTEAAFVRAKGRRVGGLGSAPSNIRCDADDSEAAACLHDWAEICATPVECPMIG
jgi:hypothetical protein